MTKSFYFARKVYASKDYWIGTCYLFLWISITPLQAQFFYFFLLFSRIFHFSPFLYFCEIVGQKRMHLMALFARTTESSKKTPTDRSWKFRSFFQQFSSTSFAPRPEIWFQKYGNPDNNIQIHWLFYFFKFGTLQLHCVSQNLLSLQHLSEHSIITVQCWFLKYWQLFQLINQTALNFKLL